MALNRKSRSVRIWVYWNRGLVRIHLNDGKPLILRCHALTDEGYEEEEVRYQLTDGLIVAERMLGGRDCDGPYRYTSICKCPVYLSSVIPKGNDVLLPVWRLVEEWQHDAFADAMGY